ncbi:MAG: redoxin domain-containing protein [Actinobacteria bacterium]|uniref:Unannotated protein n=1 Tax=freshwater metagenome TaxID=449393 RepID=A0A6J6ZGU7_9ZZZZ|nr:redoxin domain-containing protein [Actinomycetota bacterium]MSW92676.1 redoxin domain-containing protein [Actinomycetota bacterium]MSX86431.1 redoxin domain-containing protein [Actinomycetota bacterium]MSY73487.1 redoxin domain-containing protein [Actinomycetota bacterium]
MLAKFASAYAIDFPLLADIGGLVIDQFGVLNPNIVPNERQAAGIPFPGQFLLDIRGRVRAKSFTGDLRHRASGTALVAESFDEYRGPSAVIETPELRAVIKLSTGHVYGGQEVSVRVDLDISPPWHVYAAKVASPYQPITVDFDIDGDLVTAQDLSWPAPTDTHFDALDASLLVHHGLVKATGRLRLRWSPPPSIFGGLDDAVRRRAIPPGTYPITCTLRYQACTDEVCVEPIAIRFTLPISVAATVVTPQPTSTAQPEES